MSNYNTIKTANTINTGSIIDGAISTAKLGASVTTLIATGSSPKITVLAYPGDDQAADPAGGQTITLTGTGFITGCTIFSGSTQVGTVTFISETSVTFTTLALASATYTVYLINPDGGTAALVPGISYSGLPNWTTSAGSIASVYEYSSISSTVTATGDAPVSYAVYSGSLPSGSSLNTSTGLISGTSIASAGATTSSFVIRATDAQLQDSDRSFSITVNTDVVTWASPTDNSTVTLPIDSASSTTLLATSAAGKSITYTANALPTGLSVVGNAVTGTPTVTGSSATLFTATAATDGKTTTATINWVVSVAVDPYFNSVTLLLSANTPTSNFIADASVNTFALTPVGTPSANTNNPLQPGYYGGSFNGSTDYITPAASSNYAFGTGAFTLEFWINPNSFSDYQYIIDTRGAGADASGFAMYSPATGLLVVAIGNAGTISASTALTVNKWQHIAVSSTGTSVTLYLNGTSIGSGTYSTNIIDTTLHIGTWYAVNGYFYNGYLSNLRIVKGVAVYTGAFTPPTAPLAATQSAGTNIAAITGTATSLLTCQSYRFIDNSTYQATLTPTGPPRISVTQPFTLPSPYTGYGAGLFNGTTDYLQSPSNAALTLGTSDFTIEAWVYLTVAGSASVIGPVWDGRPSVNGAYPYLLVQGNTTNYNVAWYVNATNQVTAPTLALNTWHHIAYSRSYATAGRLFVNGALIQSWVDNVNYLGSQGRIGSNYDASGLLGGYISNLRITKGTAVYTGAFTPPTLAPLTNAGATSAACYPSTTNVNTTFASSATSLLTLQNNQAQNNNQFRDSSTNNFAVTRTGTPTQGTFTPFSQTGWSGFFNASTAYLSVPNTVVCTLSSGSTGDYTIECWVYPTAAPGSDYGTLNCILMGTGPAGTGQSSLYGFIPTGYLFWTRDGATARSITGTIPTLNVWSHLAFVNVGTTMTVYLNGQSVGSVSIPGTWNSSQLYAYIGYTGYAGGYFPGYISNLRIVKNTAVYTGNFTVPTAPLQATQSAGTNIAAITGTVTNLLTLQSNYFKDNSTNNFAITASGTPSIQAFSPFAPTTTYSASAVGGSMYFNGSSYLSAPSNSAFGVGTGDFTIEAWIYPFSWPAAGNYSAIVQISGTSIWFGLNSAGFGLRQGNVGNIISYATNPTINAWTHVAVARVGTACTLYYNGVSVATATSSASFATGTAYIACDETPGNYFTGYISNSRLIKGTAVYTGNFTTPTAPLTAIAGTSLLLNATNSGIYDSTGKNDLTTVGDVRTSTAVIKYGSSSMYFDGTGDYLNSPNSLLAIQGSEAFTLEAWIYPTSVAGDLCIYETRGGSGWVFFINSSGKLQVYDTVALVQTQSTVTLTANTWAFVSLVRVTGSSTVTYYVGGTAAGTFTLASFATATQIRIGARNDGLYPYIGYIDDLRVTKGIARYTTTFTPPTVPFALQ